MTVNSINEHPDICSECIALNVVEVEDSNGWEHNLHIFLDIVLSNLDGNSN